MPSSSRPAPERELATSPHTGVLEEATVVDEDATAPSANLLPAELELDTDEMLAEAKQHLLGNYRPAPVVFVRGEGCVLVDSRGGRYLDFAAGVAVNALGHAHPKLVRTIAEQAGKLMHVSNYFYNAENVLLAKELCEKTGFDRAFFCNSGGEANEAMLKLARRHFYAKGDKEKYRFVAFDKGEFIGREAALAMQASDPPLRLALLEVDASDAVAHGHEPVHHAGRRIGYVTSGAYGHHVQRNLALAYLESRLCRTRDPLSVTLIGKPRAARVLEAAPYDPHGTKLRG